MAQCGSEELPLSTSCVDAGASLRDASASQSGVLSAPKNGTEQALRGQEIEIGPGVAYVSWPQGAVGSTPRCIVLLHDILGFRSGRHRELADAIAAEGWLAFLPEFSIGAGTELRPMAHDVIRGFLVDYLLPWLEEVGIVSCQCIGFCTGALTTPALLDALNEHHANGAKVPVFLAAAFAQPAFGKPHVKDQCQLQKVVASIPFPLLLMPAKGDPDEVRPGGVVEQQQRSHGLEFESVEFRHVDPGFMTQGDFASPEVSEAVEWALRLSSEFFHHNFEKSSATQE